MYAKTATTAALLLTSVCANAALYRWIDANGVAQFSDQPPPAHAQGETLTLDVPKPASGSVPPPESTPSFKKSNAKKPFKQRRATRRTNTARRSAAKRRSSAAYNSRSAAKARIRTTY